MVTESTYAVRQTSRRTIRLFGAAFFVALPLAACHQAPERLEPVPATSADTSAVRSAGSSAVLAAGDVVRIAVWKRPELSGDFAIALDGTIIHPLYRHIVAGGVAMPQLESRIRTFLLQFEQNPEFVLSPMFRVFVGGEVHQPGVLTVPAGTTVATCIALAGGQTEDGRLDRVRLTRDLRPYMLDLTGGDTTVAQLEAHSSDQLEVTRRHSFVRDNLLPAASVVGAIASVYNLVLILRRN